MAFDPSLFCIAPDHSIHDAIVCIERNAQGIALVADEAGHLLGTITDGDVRRAILAGQSLELAVHQLLTDKAHTPLAQPVTAPLGSPRTALLSLMQAHKIRQVPLLDNDGRIAGLVTLDELLPRQVLPLQAVIMAGGLGTRLRPLTDELPKPMLPLGDRPLMERIIAQLRQSGIRRVNVATHYMPEKITDYFGDGAAFGVELNYVQEDQPLGTAGALGLMETPDEPLLVINGDILTLVDFRSLLKFHRKHNADLTVAVRRYDLQVPYGVIESDGPFVQAIREKPLLSFFVNAGIYLLEPLVHRYISSGERLDMTDLVERLIAEQRTIVSFPIVEYWLDIGQHADYEQAQKDIETGRLAS